MNKKHTTHFAYSLVALAVFSTMQSSHAQEATEEANKEEAYEQISVTANRRSQSIVSVPYNISAIGGETLKKAGITDLGDLTRRVPGISFTDRGARSGAFTSSIAMRGLSVEDGRVSGPLYTAPGVSTYVGETPLFTNIRFNDVERVEILRGPQGTLYGSGSLGGTLRFIPNAPDLEFGFVEVDAGISQTKNGDGLDNETNLVFNFPLADNFAIRGNIGVDNRAGWIDQPFSYELDNAGLPILSNPDDYLNSPAQFVSREGINHEDSVYGRLSALWQISDDTKITLAWNKQDDESGGNPARSVRPAGTIYEDLDDYDSAALTVEPYDGEAELLSMDFETHIGFATFTASLSTYDSEQNLQSDQTGVYQQYDFYSASYGAMPRPLVADFSSNDDSADIVEVRLVSDIDGPFSYVIGAFYMDQEINIRNFQFYRDYSRWADTCAIERPDLDGCGLGTTFGDYNIYGEPGLSPTVQEAGLPLLRDRNFLAQSNATFTDRAVFGELTWAATDDINLTAGFRRFSQEYNNTQTNAAFFVDSASVSAQNSDFSDTLFKLNGSWQINEEVMLYSTWSEGFRRGGANALPESVLVFNDDGSVLEFFTNQNLTTYAPDTVTNKEIGIKGFVGGTRYTFALFGIDWENIQLDTLVTPYLLNAVVNAGEASSRGFEAEIITSLGDNWDLTLGYSFVDATLDSPDVEGLQEARVLPNNDDGASPEQINLALEGIMGARLPNVAEHTAMVDLAYNFEMGDFYGTWNINANYRSDTLSILDPAIQTEAPGFSIWNTGLTIEKDNWSVRFFVDNLFNEEGIINIPAEGPAGPRRNELLSRPRVIGLSASYLFEF